MKSKSIIKIQIIHGLDFTCLHFLYKLCKLMPSNLMLNSEAYYVFPRNVDSTAFLIVENC